MQSKCRCIFLFLCAFFFGPLLVAQQLQSTFDQRGLSKLSYNGISLVDLNSHIGDAFYVGSYNLGGTGGWGGIGNTSTWNAGSQTLVWSYSWGSVSCQFVTATATNTLTLNVTITNSSNQSLNAIDIFPFGIQFPNLPTQFGNASYPQFHNNLDNTSIIAADYGSGMLVLSNGDAKPLFLGFSPSVPTNHYALLAGTMNDTSEGFLASAIPVNRPVAAGQSDHYSFSLQFAPSGTDYHSLTAGVVSAYAQAWPQLLQWTDRRPIGELFMTNPTSSAIPNSNPNPRNYTVAQNINIQTPQGLAAFQQAALAYADNSVKILQNMNAQGAIVWDLEGQQFPQPNTSYVGDPTQLPNMAPEMNAIADQFFAKFTSAGLRCGMTLRPQQLDFTVTPPNQSDIPIQSEAALLISKIQYAYNRWGCTIYYVDSDGGPDDATAPSTFAQVLQALPNILIVPENIWVKDSAYTAPLASFWAPYKPLHTTADEKAIWPKAFTVTYIGDAPNDDLSNNPANPTQWSDFVNAVAGGDILSFRAWFDDEPLNGQVTQIYQAAAALNPGSPATSVTITPGSGSLSAKQTLQFTAAVAGTTNKQVAWSISPAGSGSISSAGLYTAPSSIMSQATTNVFATSLADSTKSASATVTLNSSVSIAVAPSSGMLNPSQTLQFTASVSGTTNQSVTWSLLPAGAGSISSSGFYTAPASIATSQTVTIQAVSSADSSKIATASVSLSPASCPAAAVNAFTGCYYLDQTFGSSSGLGFTRIDPQINFNWGVNGVGNGVGPNNFSVRWQGNFTFNAATYTFSLASDDGSLLYIDGQQVINEGGIHAAYSATQSVNLTAGSHLVELDYFQAGGLASAALSWTQNPGTISISLSPAVGGNISEGQSLQFSAAVTGSANQAVTWTISPVGTGSISASGLYTAPAWITSQQNVTITATSAADATRSSSASVTLLPPAAAPAAGCIAPATNAFTGCYYGDQTFGSTSGLLFSRADPQINFNWGTSGPGNGAGAYNFSVRWQGNFTFAAGTYTFSLSTDDGSTLYVDGKPLITEPGTHAAYTTTQSVILTAGSHLIQVDYFQAGGGASASLNWSQTGGFVATTCPGPATNAFTGCYYGDQTFGSTSRLLFSRTDSKINFDWGTNGPGNGASPYNFSVRWQGNFVLAAGTYNFSASTDDGSVLYIDGQAVINEPGVHPAYITSQQVKLTAGTHLIELDYVQAGGGASANVSWSQQ